MGHDPQLREMESPRLDSWKEIASFLHRDARTVRRWERERRLPVHRVPGGERSGVFAYVAELERWLHAASPAAEVAPPQPPVPLRVKIDANQGEISSAGTAQDSSPDADSIGLPAEEQVPPTSAFQSLNSHETTFAAVQVASEGSFSAIPHPPTAIAKASSRPHPYQVVALLVLMLAAAGISAAVGHYREANPVKPPAHKPSPDAQDLYLRGRYYWNLRTEEGLNSAVDLFTQSIVADPRYADAYAGLADAYLLLRQYGHMPNEEAYPRALAAARRAIALDDASPDAHRSTAFILRFWNWDMVAAEKEYRRAIDLNPNDSLSHHWYATALLSTSRYMEALAQIDIARELEPQSVSVLADRGLILSSMDPHAGVVALQQVERAEPGFPSTHGYLASAYLEVGDYEGFLTESRTAAELSHNSATIAPLDAARKTLANRGPGPMLRQLASDFALLTDRGAMPAYNTARLFGLAGESQQAMRYLRVACDHREPGFLTVEDDGAFNGLRSSQDYLRLISRRDLSLKGKQPIAMLDHPQPAL